MMIQRRAFLAQAGRGMALGVTGLVFGPACRTAAERERGHDSALKTRGVVLVPEDLSLADWPERARRAGLTTIGIHHPSSPLAVVRWVGSEAGGKFLEDCRKLGLEVEYELHAMRELLPRDLFAKEPGLFRMGDSGDRTPDANCCVHSARALEIIAENASKIAGSLRPTTGRYFFWGDDGQPWCRCPKCRELSDPEQALVLENSLLAALRRLESRAQFAHLAYANTLRPPAKVRPDPGVFLEYAPIARRYDIPYAMQRGPADKDGLQALEANLRVFPPDTAQVLEYWLDASRFSQWKRPAVRIPWNRQVFLSDVRTYSALGIRHVTTFAAWVDADYLKRFGDLAFLDEYGAGLMAE